MKNYRGELLAASEMEKMLFTQILSSCGYCVSVMPKSDGTYRLEIFIQQQGDME